MAWQRRVSPVSLAEAVPKTGRPVPRGSIIMVGMLRYAAVVVAPALAGVFAAASPLATSSLAASASLDGARP
jgi:hypothetical protein